MSNGDHATVVASRTAILAFINEGLSKWYTKLPKQIDGIGLSTSACPPWVGNATSLDTVAVTLTEWLQQWGWSRGETAVACGDRNVSAPVPGGGALDTLSPSLLLRFESSGVCLHALAVAPTRSLHFDTTCPNPIARSPLVAFQEYLQRQSARVGLLCNGRALYFLLCDDACCWHELAVVHAEPRPDYAVLSCETSHHFTVLCQPNSIKHAGELASAIGVFQSERLAKLGESISVGIDRLINSILANPLNREHLEDLSGTESLAKGLWQECLLIAFSILLTARFAPHPVRPSIERAPIRAARSEQAVPHAELQFCRQQVKASLSGGKPVGLAIAFQNLVRYFDALLSEEPQTADDRSYNPSQFELLNQLNLSDEGCLQLLRATFIDTQIQAPQVGPNTKVWLQLDAFTVFELVHLFEPFIEYRPQIATAPMARYRRGKREVVVEADQDMKARQRVASMAQRQVKDGTVAGDTGSEIEGRIGNASGGKSRQGRRIASFSVAASDTKGALRAKTRSNTADNCGTWVEDIPRGHFYVSHVGGRKAAGAFYTPTAIAQLLTRQTLGAALGGSSNPTVRGLLKQSVLDPAMGIGAFLMQSTLTFGDAVFELLVGQYRCANFSNNYRASATFALSRSECEVPFAFDDRALHSLQLRCRSAFAKRAVHGVDQNVVSVLLARIALWSQCQFDESVMRGLSRHLIVGNSLTGPRLRHLQEYPVRRHPLPQSIQRDVAQLVEPSLGQSSDSTSKLALGGAHDSRARELPRSKDAAKLALQMLAAIWAGAVLDGRKDNDALYARAVEELAQCQDHAHVNLSPQMRELALLGRNSICFELAFPEQFKKRLPPSRQGFDFVIGNPPWDSVKHDTRSFLGTYDLRAHEVPTRRERDALSLKLLTKGGISEAFSFHVETFEQLKRAHDRLYSHQKLTVDGDLAGRQLDLFRLFVERSWDLVVDTGVLGQVLPSAFHTAAGATGIRRLLLSTGVLLSYTCFVNTKRWFDVSPSLQFGLLVCRRGHVDNHQVLFRFGLETPGEVQSAVMPWLSLSQNEILLNNPYATLPAVANARELEVLRKAQSTDSTFATFMKTSGLDLRSTPTSVHRTHEASHFTNLSENTDYRLRLPTVVQFRETGAVLHEGSTFERYDDTWGPAPKFALAYERVQQVARYSTAVGYYRLVMRAIVGNSPHKSIAAIIAPGTLVTNSALVEARPETRPNAVALVALVVLNSSMASALLCSSADLNANLFAIRRIPWPNGLPEAFLVHGAVRLVSNHIGFVPLLREQLGERQLGQVFPLDMPILAEKSQRMHLRGQLDAIVAMAYGLSRTHYLSVLSRFENNGAFGEGLAAYDELSTIGTARFCQKYDPFHANAVVPSLPDSSLNLKTHAEDFA